MSINATTAAAYGDVSKLRFPGGFPSSKDLAPSVIFLVAYALLAPLLVWRIISPKHRTLVLIRPGVFWLCRMGTFALRAVMSKHNYGEGELIAELVLVSIGYLFLIESTIELWRRHVSSEVPIKEAPSWVARGSKLLKFAVLAAVGLSIASSTKISSALGNPSQMQTVMNLRKAASILSTVIPVVALAAVILTHFEFRLDTRRTVYIIPLLVLLFIVSLYRLLQTYSTNPDSEIHSAVVFWILQITCEFFVFVGLLAISIPEWYPGAPASDVSSHDERYLSQQKDEEAVVGRR